MRATYEDLIRWLALTYGDNAPIFATINVDGSPLDSGIALKELYEEIVGPKMPTPGVWYRCPSCDTWRVDSTGFLSDPAPASAEC